ncbi:hypothetical protein D9M71_813250 [compost metagenome]
MQALQRHQLALVVSQFLLVLCDLIELLIDSMLHDTPGHASADDACRTDPSPDQQARATGFRCEGDPDDERENADADGRGGSSDGLVLSVDLLLERLDGVVHLVDVALQLDFRLLDIG